LSWKNLNAEQKKKTNVVQLTQEKREAQKKKEGGQQEGLGQRAGRRKKQNTLE